MLVGTVIGIPFINVYKDAAAPAIPTITSIDPAEINQGQTETIIVTGTNFTAVSTVGQVSLGTGVTINSVTVDNDTTITLEVTAAYDATLGERTLEITFDDAQVATLVDALSVIRIGSLLFDGVNDFVNFGTSQISFTDKFCIVIKTRLTAKNSVQFILGNVSNQTNSPLLIGFGSTTAGYQELYISSSNQAQRRSDGFTSSTGVWYTIVINYNYDNTLTIPQNFSNNLSVSINNMPISTIAASSWGSTTSAENTIGKRPQVGNNNNFYAGDVSEIGLHQGSIADSVKITAINNGGNFKTIMGTAITYFTFEQTTGITLPDLSGNGNNGTLNNFDVDQCPYNGSNTCPWRPI